MPCRIEITFPELNLLVGCSEGERSRPQPIGAALSISSPRKFEASRTDQLSDTIDVAWVQQTVQRAAELGPVQTLERLAERIETELRAQFRAPGLEWELTLAKPRFGWKYVQTWST